MNKILIEDIEKEANKTLFYEFNEFMKEFGADVSADLTLKSLGQFIEVSGTAQGKLKLVCDRCLNEFDYDLDIEIEETFATGGSSFLQAPKTKEHGSTNNINIKTLSNFFFIKTSHHVKSLFKNNIIIKNSAHQTF